MRFRGGSAQKAGGGGLGHTTGIVSTVTQTGINGAYIVATGTIFPSTGVFIPKNTCFTHRERCQAKLNHPFNGSSLLIEELCKDA